MDFIRNVLWLGILLLLSCSELSLKFDSIKGSTSLLSVQNSSSGASAEPASSSEPADPPPITLGSYPWILITKVTKSPDSMMTTVEGLVLDLDDPPGIPTKFGYLRVGEEESKVTYPIKVEDRLKGIISFQIPTSVFHPKELTAVMTGPGYTNIDFPVCEL